MDILYFTNLENKRYPFREIKKALENLGHKVEVVNDNDFDMEELIKKANKADLFLFHHGGIRTDSDIECKLSLARLQTILQAIRPIKVLWFLDKGWLLNDEILEQIIPLTNFTFGNDETWVRRHKYPNVFPLHCGTGERKGGRKKKEYECDIAFIGDTYGIRQLWANTLRQQFGRRFKVFNDVFDEDFNSVCKSAKAIVFPRFPADDFFWPDTIYKVMAAGGLVIYPRLEGLKQEFENKKHYLTYFSMKELVGLLNEILRPEADKLRKKIAEEGKKRVKKFTYEERLKTLFSKIYENKKNNRGDGV